MNRRTWTNIGTVVMLAFAQGCTHLHVPPGHYDNGRVRERVSVCHSDNRCSGRYEVRDRDTRFKAKYKKSRRGSRSSVDYRDRESGLSFRIKLK